MSGRSAYITVLALLCCATTLHGQIRSATITGSVSDASGAAVPNAPVVVTNQETGIRNTTKTTDAGLFTVPYLQAGRYNLAVDVSGFTPYRETGIAVETAQTVRVAVTLKVGTLESTVEVAAQAQQVQTDSATVQAAMQSDLIAAVPNPDQNPLYYAMLQNGVAPRTMPRRIRLRSTRSASGSTAAGNTRPSASTADALGRMTFSWTAFRLWAAGTTRLP